MMYISVLDTVVYLYCILRTRWLFILSWRMVTLGRGESSTVCIVLFKSMHGLEVACRVQVIGLYVGLATVGAFTLWYTQSSFLGIDLSSDGHTLVSFSQLTNWGECSTWKNFTVSPFTAGSETLTFDENPCDYFTTGKVKATTLSLSVLVAIEMFNSLNALSEDGSLVTMPPWVNPWLLLAMFISFSLHFLILYVPFLASIFGIVPLGVNEWLFVLVLALPVILIDEALKFVGRRMTERERIARKLKLA